MPTFLIPNLFYPCVWDLKICSNCEFVMNFYSIWVKNLNLTISGDKQAVTRFKRKAQDLGLRWIFLPINKRHKLPSGVPENKRCMKNRWLKGWEEEKKSSGHKPKQNTSFVPHSSVIGKACEPAAGAEALAFLHLKRITLHSLRHVH